MQALQSRVGERVAELVEVDPTGILVNIVADDAKFVLRFFPWTSVDHIEFPVEHQHDRRQGPRAPAIR